MVSNKLTGNLTFRTNDIVRMAITNGGNIGINQSSPLDKMHLTGGNLRIDNTSPQLSFYQGATFAGLVQSIGSELTISNKLTGSLTLRTNNLVRMAITNGGNIGINQSSPLDKIHLTGGNLRIENTSAQISFYQGTTFGAFIQSGLQNLLISNKNSGELQLRTNDVRRLAITHAGDVVIGTIPPATGYRLNVDGKIIAEELKVQMSELWPDYVFGEDYPLLSLSDLKEYVSEHRHLPGIPSAGDVTNAQGIEVGEMNRLLLEKIEELTLYIIDLQDQIDTLRNH
jgi:hypothetical protein